MPDQLLLAFGSIWLASLLSAGAAENAPSIACIAAGVFGGTVSQMLMSQKRKLPVVVLMGEIMASGTMGFAVFAGIGTAEPKVLLASILAGGGGGLLFHKMVRSYHERWGKDD